MRTLLLKSNPLTKYILKQPAGIGRPLLVAGFACLLAFSGPPSIVAGQTLEADPAVSLTPLQSLPEPSKQFKPYLPQTPQPIQTNPSESSKPFELSVTQTRFLPDAMYGRWSVTAKLTKTDIPGGIPELSYNNWELAQMGGSVYISNIDNGARASIDVDEVKNRTATFHHKVLLPERNPLRILFGRENSERDFMVEQPTVTVDGDRMVGKTIQRFYHVKNGDVARVYTAEFLLHAERLTDGRVRMGEKASELDFEIEEIQQESELDAEKNPATIDSALYAR